MIRARISFALAAGLGVIFITLTVIPMQLVSWHGRVPVLGHILLPALIASFLVGGLYYFKRTWPMIASLIAAFAVASALSVLGEVVQTESSSRVAAWSDLALGLVGSLLGVFAGWRILNLFPKHWRN